MKVKYILAALIAALALFTFGGGQIIASADATAYTGVLEDLRTDENFNIEDYPQNDDDYGLKVIQIAESSARELFIYVYQPTGQTKNYRATCINMTTVKAEFENDTDNGYGVGSGVGGYVGGGHGGGSFRPRTADNTNEAEPKLYTLRFLNEYKTLYKYKVVDFTLKSDSERYYDITSVYRKFDSTVDEPPASGGTYSEVAFPVGQFWTVATDESKKVTYDYDEIELITVNEQTVGCRVYDSGPWSGKAAYFFAFTCDHKIDRLISASLSFCTEDIVICGAGGQYPNLAGYAVAYGDPIQHNKTYFEDEYAETINGGWLGKKVRWDRIASTAEFLSLDLEFVEEEQKLISKYDWVINFYETDYTKSTSVSGTFNGLGWLIYWITGRLDQYYDYHFEGVNDVTLLRLEFETEGHVYDVGVISDKSSSIDITSGGRTRTLWDYFLNFCKWLENLTGVSYIFWAFLFIAIPVCLLLGVLAVFLPPVKIALKFAFKGLIIAVTAPFKLIAAAVRRYQANAPKRAQRKAERLRKKDFKEQMKAQAQDLKERKTQRKQAEQARKLSARSDKLSALEQRDLERAYNQRRKAKRRAQNEALKQQKKRNQKKKKKR